MSTTAYESFLWTCYDDGAFGDRFNWYREGASLGDGWQNESGTTTGGCVIGSLNGSTSDFDIDGDIADFAVWNETLTLADSKALAAGVTPDQIRPDKLVAYMPMIGDTGNDRIISPWTKNGTLAVAEHAPVFQRSAQILRFAPAAAAGGGGIEILRRRTEGS